MRSADLVLLVLDASQPLQQADEALLRETKDYPGLILCNKSDRKSAFSMPEALKISAATGEGLDVLRKRIVQCAGTAEAPPLTSARHMRLARQAAAQLRAAAASLAQAEALDLAAVDLQAALEQLGEITGERVNEKLLDTVFSNFCVGK